MGKQIKFEKQSIYRKGICFICNNPCDPEGYAHYVCSLAVALKDEENIKEMNKNES